MTGEASPNYPSPSGTPDSRGRSGRSPSSFLRRTLTRERATRIAISLGATVVGLLFVLWLGQLGVYNLSYAISLLPSLQRGFEITAELVGVVITLGFAVGFLVGWGRTSRSVLLRGFGALYVDFFRSMPPIVLIAFAFLISLVFLRKSVADPYLAGTIALWFGAVALGLHTAAYQAEIVRAGILSVPYGQTEAADAIGLSRVRTMFLVTLPQAFRVSLPALGNEFSSVIKDTSLLSVIGWLDLSGTGLVLVYAGLRVYLFAPILVWVEIAILYFILTFAVNTVVRAIENASKVPGLEAAQL